MQITYTTITDYITAVVAPALEHDPGTYDLEDIARDMTQFNEAGRLVERQDVDFWEIVAKHEI